MPSDNSIQVRMDHYEKKSHTCICPKCLVSRSSYCNIEYMPDGKPKPVDGVCPCCWKVNSHEQATDDEDTEDEGAQEEYANVQPYVQMLHDVKRSIEGSKAEADDTAQMLHIRRIPCAGNTCPARFHSLCSVRNIRLPHGEITLECPCDNICFTLNCVKCNSKGVD